MSTVREVKPGVMGVVASTGSADNASVIPVEWPKVRFPDAEKIVPSEQRTIDRNEQVCGFLLNPISSLGLGSFVYRTA